jgi:hypothetical protein
VGGRSIFVDGVLEPSSDLVAEIDRREPYPWHRYTSFVERSYFDRLRRDFPPLQWFRHDQNRYRGPQRPHDRHLLAWSTDSAASDGLVPHAQLAASWRSFIDALQGDAFTRYFATVLGERPHLIRFDWHRSYRGCEVSPHPDDPYKIGTMIFYFNTPEDWDASYGGDTLLLGGLQQQSRAPEYADFATVTPVPMLATQCFFFRRSPHSWHAVARLQCPNGAYRNTFHAIAERERPKRA